MPDQITRLLDQIDNADKHATPGPWDSHFGGNPHDEWLSVEPEKGSRTICTVTDDHIPNGAFIALARTVLPQLAKALRAVMEIHKPFHADHYYNGMDGESLHRFVLRCDGCEESGGIEDYPCPTVQAITDAMEGDDD